MGSISHTTAEGRTVTAIVREALVRDRLRRARLAQQSIKAVVLDEDDVVGGLLRLNSYPSCVGCTVELRDSDNPDRAIDDLSFDDFLDLPDEFLIKWTAEAFKLNPGWKDLDTGPRATPSSKQGKHKSSSIVD